MARVYKKPCYRPVPTGARIESTADGKKYAVWIVGGKQWVAEYVETKNGPRIIQESNIYIARYTDAQGKFRERSTGCRDLQAAEFKLQTWLQEVERIKSGIVTQEESDIGTKTKTAVEDLYEDYKAYHKLIGASAKHTKMVVAQIKTICEECGFEKLSDIQSKPFVAWLNTQGDRNMGASTRNAYRSAIVAFMNWVVEEAKCLTANPLLGVPKANVKADRRHKRRAMTPDEVVLLLEAAEKRPLHDRLVITKGQNKGQYCAKVGEEEKEKARRLGRERQLLYAALLYTGLRKSELGSITVGQVMLDEKIPYLFLFAKDAKTDEEASVPIHPALLKPLKEWLETRKAEGRLSPRDKLFQVPDGLSKILDRDLAFAGIAKKDALGRVIDVHALRYTHGTLMMRSNVDMLVTQKSLRHADVRMTSGIYTQRELDIVAGGVSQLPDFFAAPQSEKKNGDDKAA